MTPWYTYILAYLVGILFNLNPSCGSGTMIWTATQKSRWLVFVFATIRIVILGIIGTIAAYLGTTLRLPWGILMVLTALYLLYTTFQQSQAGQSGACNLSPQSRGLPWLMAITPPPSGYIGLAFFFGGFNPPTPVEGAGVLIMIGLGLTTPIWAMLIRPEWWMTWQSNLSNNPKWYRVQITFQYAGSLLFLIVGLAFIFIRDFHRPLLEVIH